jgi:hypothetical protein
MDDAWRLPIRRGRREFATLAVGPLVTPVKIISELTRPLTCRRGESHINFTLYTSFDTLPEDAHIYISACYLGHFLKGKIFLNLYTHTVMYIT